MLRVKTTAVGDQGRAGGRFKLSDRTDAPREGHSACDTDLPRTGVGQSSGGAVYPECAGSTPGRLCPSAAGAGQEAGCNASVRRLARGVFAVWLGLRVGARGVGRRDGRGASLWKSRK